MKTLPLILTSLAALLAQSALAHTELAASTPANHATVASAPESVELKFSEPVRLTALTIQPEGAAKQSLGPLPSATTANFSITLPKLGNGSHVVTWRALSEDTHVMQGEFMFVVGAAGEPATHEPQAAHDEHSAHQTQAPQNEHAAQPAAASGGGHGAH